MDRTTSFFPAAGTWIETQWSGATGPQHDCARPRSMRQRAARRYVPGGLRVAGRWDGNAGRELCRERRILDGTTHLSRAVRHCRQSLGERCDETRIGRTDQIVQLIRVTLQVVKLLLTRGILDV